MKSAADIFDRIAASTPLNATAARVTSQNGDHYEPEQKIGTQQHWTAPPRCVKGPDVPGFIDLTGKRFGSLTTIGFLGGNNKRGLWLVRCDCGDYESRRTKTVKNGKPEDCCQKCQRWRYVQRRYNELGPAPLSTFIGDRG